MAQTEKGIVYPFDYNEVADVPADFKALAESIDTLLNRYSQNTELEDTIVDVSYNDGILTFTFKDESTKTVSIADLVSGLISSTDIVDNLTTNDSTKVLSAKQGKILYDMIGDVESLLEVI